MGWNGCGSAERRCYSPSLGVAGRAVLVARLAEFHRRRGMLLVVGATHWCRWGSFRAHPLVSVKFHTIEAGGEESRHDSLTELLLCKGTTFI